MSISESEIHDLIASIIHRMMDAWGVNGVNLPIVASANTHCQIIEEFEDLSEEFYETFAHLPAFIPVLDELLQNCLYAYMAHTHIQLPVPLIPLSVLDAAATHTEEIAAKLKYLREIPQPEQRTPAWYRFRYDLITASNAHKALHTNASKNSLIYEKCKPLDIAATDAITTTPELNFVDMINTNSPMHWGQKYEPLSVALYERIYNTHVGAFGCIRHPDPKYSFLGASPDGINDDPASPLYGRMLEIKNVVSRVIDGIPKREYAVQMQMQMEVCDLDDCDFLETKFVEYADTDIDQFYAEVAERPTMRTIQGQTIPRYYGMMLQFRQRNIDTPYYLYRIWDSTVDTRKDFEQWEYDTIIDEHRASDVNEYGDRYTQWLQTIYWKLDVFSCSYCTRDRAWFNLNAPQFTTLWDTVLRERIEGYEHRAPVRRTPRELADTTTTNDTKEITTFFVDEGAPSTKNKWAKKDYSVCLFDNAAAAAAELPYKINKLG